MHHPSLCTSHLHLLKLLMHVLPGIIEPKSELHVVVLRRLNNASVHRLHEEEVDGHGSEEKVDEHVDKQEESESLKQERERGYRSRESIYKERRV